MTGNRYCCFQNDSFWEFPATAHSTIRISKSELNTATDIGTFCVKEMITIVLKLPIYRGMKVMIYEIPYSPDSTILIRE